MRERSETRRRGKSEWSEGALEGREESGEEGGEGRGGGGAADAGAQRGQGEPSELQRRSGSPTFLWNTVFTRRSSGGGAGQGCEGDDTQGRKSCPGDALLAEQRHCGYERLSETETE